MMVTTTMAVAVVVMRVAPTVTSALAAALAVFAAALGVRSCCRCFFRITILAILFHPLAHLQKALVLTAFEVRNLPGLAVSHDEQRPAHVAQLHSR